MSNAQQHVAESWRNVLRGVARHASNAQQHVLRHVSKHVLNAQPNVLRDVLSLIECLAECLLVQSISYLV